MENIIVKLNDIPTADDAFKAFKAAVANVVKRHSGHPIELNRASSALYARVPEGNIDKIKTELGDLRL